MKRLILFVLLAFGVAACAPVKQDTDEGAAAEGATAGALSGQDDSEGTALLAGKTVSYEKNAINDPDNVLFERVVYFDFDSSAIRDEYVELVKHHGKYLALNTSAKVRLEGHTDERGTREYNVALADRRAQSVKKLLLFEGASGDQITIISYGEEKPADPGHNERAWSLNRRVEFVY